MKVIGTYETVLPETGFLSTTTKIIVFAIVFLVSKKTISVRGNCTLTKTVHIQCAISKLSTLTDYLQAKCHRNSKMALKFPH